MLPGWLVHIDLALEQGVSGLVPGHALRSLVARIDHVVTDLVPVAFPSGVHGLQRYPLAGQLAVKPAGIADIGIAIKLQYLPAVGRHQ